MSVRCSSQDDIGLANLVKTSKKLTKSKNSPVKMETNMDEFLSNSVGSTSTVDLNDVIVATVNILLFNSFFFDLLLRKNNEG